MTQPTLKVRRAQERGAADHGWLRSHHTFSFADYRDSAWMGFRGLRVINDDTVAPGQGFSTHGHRDMEIISYVLEGALSHRDSMGTGSIIRPGDVQRMSAGSGIQHSEFNASETEPVHFLQLWIEPSARGIAPSYEQKTFAATNAPGALHVIASADGTPGIKIHADATLYAGHFARADVAQYEAKPGRHTWIHLATGKARMGAFELLAGDAVYTSDVGAISIEGLEKGTQVLVFDLA